MSLLNTLNTLFIVTCLTTGCGKQDAVAPVAAAGDAQGTQQPALQVPGAPVVQQPVTPVGVAVVVTVYAKTGGEAPINGWPTKTYTATGYCAVYTGLTYCWDDGVKTLQWQNNSTFYGPFTYTYWNMSQNSVGYSSAHGGLVQDLMATPRVIGQGIGVNLVSALSTVNAVLSTGTATSYNCVDTAGNVDCGNFVIDTTQVAL